MKPIYIHSGMAGAPQYANANDNIIGILEACLINGFNSKTATSASASGGVLTLNFAANPGFEALQTVEVAVSSVAMVNGQHRVIENASNQVTISIPGLPDGTVGSSGAGITIKQAGAGWSKPFSASTKAVFRPPAGNRRYLRLVNAINANVQARGYEDMTDVDTGTGPFPTVAQVATPDVLQNNSFAAAVNSAWFLIATSKGFYFAVGNAVAATYCVGVLTFGDMAGVTVAGDAYSSVCSGLSGTLYMARNYAGAVGAISVTARHTDGASQTWPSVVADGTQFLPYVPVVEGTGNVLRGVMPNAYKAYPQLPASRFLDIYSNVTGTASRMKPVASFANAVMPYCIAVDDEAWD